MLHCWRSLGLNFVFAMSTLWLLCNKSFEYLRKFEIEADRGEEGGCWGNSGRKKGK